MNPGPFAISMLVSPADHQRPERASAPTLICPNKTDPKMKMLLAKKYKPAPPMPVLPAHACIKGYCTGHESKYSDGHHANYEDDCYGV